MSFVPIQQTQRTQGAPRLDSAALPFLCVLCDLCVEKNLGGAS